MGDTKVRHPWDQWFLLDEFVLKKGVAFDCQIHGMSVQIRQRAAERGCRVSVRARGKEIRVKVIEREE